jgi:hypothetical protein
MSNVQSLPKQVASVLAERWKSVISSSENVTLLFLNARSRTRARSSIKTIPPLGARRLLWSLGLVPGRTEQRMHINNKPE